MTRLALALAAALIATPAAAEMRQFGDVIFLKLPGWTDLRGTGATRALWSDLPDERCEYCRIMIGPEAPAKGSLTDWLTAQRLAFVDEDERDDWRIAQAAAPTSTGRHDAAMLGQTDGSDTQLLVAIAAGGRFHLLGFHGDASDEAALKDSTGTMTDTFLPWLTTLRFPSEGAAPLLGKPVPGKMTGLWWGMRLDPVMQIDLTMQMQTTMRHMVFWPDGTFYDGTPPAGLAPPDRAALIAARDTDWGNYVQTGGRIALTFADGHAEELEGDSDTWSGGGFDMHRVEPLPDGARLDGMTSWIHYTGFSPGSGIVGGAGGGGATTYKPDGSYTDSRYHGVSGGFDGGGGFALSGSDEGSGRYEVRDGLLVLTPKTGKGPKPSLIFKAGDDVMIEDEFFKGSVLP